MVASMRKGVARSNGQKKDPSREKTLTRAAYALLFILPLSEDSSSECQATCMVLIEGQR